jgi:hypothetical protein
MEVLDKDGWWFEFHVAENKICWVAETPDAHDSGAKDTLEDAILWAENYSKEHDLSDPSRSSPRMKAAMRIQTPRAALTEIRDRIKDHPAYPDLTEEWEETETGGDTAEFSYLARVADDALGA